MPIHTRTQDKPIAIPYSPPIQGNNAWIHTYIASRNLQKPSSQNTKILQWKAKNQRKVALTCRGLMAHQNPPYLAFCTPGQNETKNKIQEYQRETNKNIHIFLNEHQGIKGMGNINH